MRVTRDGLAYLLLTSALTAVAMLSGNNLLFLLVAPLWSLWLVQWPLGRWNLRGLGVRRSLPAELYAGQAGTGAWVVHNPRRFGGAYALEVDEEAGHAHAHVDVLPPRGARSVSTAWHFDQRGPVGLGTVRLRSTWPFGLVAHEVAIALPAHVLVYPRPLPGRGGGTSSGPGGARRGRAPGRRRRLPGPASLPRR